MDRFVAETQERGNRTPTLSGEKEGENMKSSHGTKHETKNVSWHRGSDAPILPPGLGYLSKNRSTTSASLWAKDERTVVHESLGLDATPTYKWIMLAAVVFISGKSAETSEVPGAMRARKDKFFFTQVLCYEIESWVRSGIQLLNWYYWTRVGKLFTPKVGYQ